MNHLLLAVSIVCLLMVGYTTVNGAEWVLLHRDKSHTLFYDSKSITSDGEGTIKVWEKDIPSEEIKQKVSAKMKQEGTYDKKWDDMSYTLLLVVIKCNTREFDESYVSYYDSKGGQIREQRNDPSFQPIPPDTRMELLYKAVCKK